MTYIHVTALVIPAALVIVAAFAFGQAVPAPKAGGIVVKIPSTLDKTPQLAIFHCPDAAKPDAKGEAVPLLVGLHTWSDDYQQDNGYVREGAKRGWVVIQPNFRGPNMRPEACASDLAIQDVLDAVAYACENAKVDRRRIYLVGVSGGGHMGLMMAAKAPKLWAGVSVWVPVGDLAAWHASLTRPDLAGYRAQVEKIIGGKPGSPGPDAELKKRSPDTFLSEAKGLPVDVNTGITDGHTGSVPVEQSLRAFNILAVANGHPEAKLADADIRVMTDEQKIPEALKGPYESEPNRAQKLLFRRQAGPARITVFKGGHSMDLPVALDWLAKQSLK